MVTRGWEKNLKKQKLCKKCGLEKEKTDFYKDKQNKDGLGSYCKTCHKENVRKNYKLNPEKILVRTKKWQKDNPEKRAKIRRKYQYGISSEEYEHLITLQHGLCAICGKTETYSRKKSLSVDHDHNTKRIRGLLCSRCNTVLGLIGDSTDLLTNCLDYLYKSLED